MAILLVRNAWKPSSKAIPCRCLPPTSTAAPLPVPVWGCTRPALPPTSRPSGWRASSRLEPGGQSYRVHKGIRDLLVFSEQDLIKDPPFSKLDLISCRNLLIYLDADLQKLIPLFHYALNPNGHAVFGHL
jgi:hypothetical protein